TPEALSIGRGACAEAALAPMRGSEYLKRRKRRLCQAQRSVLKRFAVQRGRGVEGGAPSGSAHQSGISSPSRRQHLQCVCLAGGKAFQTAEKIGPDGIAGPLAMKELGL